MLQSPRKSLRFRLTAVVINFCFIASFLNPARSYAQTPADLGMPAPGIMVNLTPAYVPVIAKGLRVHPENPILFDMIVDTGNSKLTANDQQLKSESEKIIKYFLAALTIPDDDQWVNLSPYEKDRMINDQLGLTDMGRDMLAQDYILKQLTASLIDPQKSLGKEFWNKIYTKAQQLYGTNDVPVNTFNKVWIVADKANIYVHDNTAYVTSSHLKVMLEEDYVALNKNNKSAKSSEGITTENNTHSVGSQIVREIILPELEKEVNTGKNFANLRQIFHSMVLAAWYKKNLKESLLNQVYSDKAKTKGVDVADPTIKEQIYQEYLKAYKKGVFNFIKEDVVNGQTVPRKYFSGGLAVHASAAMRIVDAAQAAEDLRANPAQGVLLDAKFATPGANASSAAMNAEQKASLRSFFDLHQADLQSGKAAEVLIKPDATVEERVRIISELKTRYDVFVSEAPIILTENEVTDWYEDFSSIKAKSPKPDEDIAAVKGNMVNNPLDVLILKEKDHSPIDFDKLTIAKKEIRGLLGVKSTDSLNKIHVADSIDSVKREIKILKGSIEASAAMSAVSVANDRNLAKALSGWGELKNLLRNALTAHITPTEKFYGLVTPFTRDLVRFGQKSEIQKTLRAQIEGLFKNDDRVGRLIVDGQKVDVKDVKGEYVVEARSLDNVQNLVIGKATGTNIVVYKKVKGELIIVTSISIQWGSDTRVIVTTEEGVFDYRLSEQGVLQPISPDGIQMKPNGSYISLGGNTLLWPEAMKAFVKDRLSTIPTKERHSSSNVVDAYFMMSKGGLMTGWVTLSEAKAIAQRMINAGGAAVFQSEQGLQDISLMKMTEEDLLSNKQVYIYAGVINLVRAAEDFINKRPDRNIGIEKHSEPVDTSANNIQFRERLEEYLENRLRVSPREDLSARDQVYLEERVHESIQTIVDALLEDISLEAVEEHSNEEKIIEKLQDELKGDEKNIIFRSEGKLYVHSLQWILKNMPNPERPVGENISGDQQKLLDFVFNQLLKYVMRLQVHAIISEEDEHVIYGSGASRALTDGYRIIAFLDPIDGSSQIKEGGSFGSIITYGYLKPGQTIEEGSFVPRDQLLTSFDISFGPNTTLTLTNHANAKGVAEIAQFALTRSAKGKEEFRHELDVKNMLDAEIANLDWQGLVPKENPNTVLLLARGGSLEKAKVIGHAQFVQALEKRFGVVPIYSGALASEMKHILLANELSGPKVAGAMYFYAENKLRQAFEGIHYASTAVLTGAEVIDGQQPLMNLPLVDAEGQSLSARSMPYYGGSAWMTKLMMSWSYYIQKYMGAQNVPLIKENLDAHWHLFFDNYLGQTSKLVEEVAKLTGKSEQEVRKALLSFDGRDMKEDYFPWLIEQKPEVVAEKLKFEGNAAMSSGGKDQKEQLSWVERVNTDELTEYEEKIAHKSFKEPITSLDEESNLMYRTLFSDNYSSRNKIQYDLMKMIQDDDMTVVLLRAKGLPADFKEKNQVRLAIFNKVKKDDYRLVGIIRFEDFTKEEAVIGSSIKMLALIRKRFVSRTIKLLLEHKITRNIKLITYVASGILDDKDFWQGIDIKGQGWPVFNLTLKDKSAAMSVADIDPDQLVLQPELFDQYGDGAINIFHFNNGLVLKVSESDIKSHEVTAILSQGEAELGRVIYTDENSPHWQNPIPKTDKMGPDWKAVIKKIKDANPAQMSEEEVGAVLSRPENKFLVVDDHPMIRGAVKDYLESIYGVAPENITEAGNGVEAQALLGTHNVVITDVQMPQMGGFDLVKIIRQNYPDMVVVAHSLMAEDAMKAAFAQFNVQLFIKAKEMEQMFAQIAKELKDQSPAMSAADFMEARLNEVLSQWEDNKKALENADQADERVRDSINVKELRQSKIKLEIRIKLLSAKLQDAGKEIPDKAKPIAVDLRPLKVVGKVVYKNENKALKITVPENEKIYISLNLNTGIVYVDETAIEVPSLKNPKTRPDSEIELVKLALLYAGYSSKTIIEQTNAAMMSLADLEQEQKAIADLIVFFSKPKGEKIALTQERKAVFRIPAFKAFLKEKGIHFQVEFVDEQMPDELWITTAPNGSQMGALKFLDNMKRISYLYEDLLPQVEAINQDIQGKYTVGILDPKENKGHLLVKFSERKDISTNITYMVDQGFRVLSRTVRGQAVLFAPDDIEDVGSGLVTMAPQVNRLEGGIFERDRRTRDINNVSGITREGLSDEKNPIHGFARVSNAWNSFKIATEGEDIFIEGSFELKNHDPKLANAHGNGKIVERYTMIGDELVSKRTTTGEKGAIIDEAKHPFQLYTPGETTLEADVTGQFQIKNEKTKMVTGKILPVPENFNFAKSGGALVTSALDHTFTINPDSQGNIKVVMKDQKRKITSTMIMNRTSSLDAAPRTKALVHLWGGNEAKYKGVGAVEDVDVTVNGPNRQGEEGGSVPFKEGEVRTSIMSWKVEVANAAMRSPVPASQWTFRADYFSLKDVARQTLVKLAEIKPANPKEVMHAVIKQALLGKQLKFLTEQQFIDTLYYFLTDEKTPLTMLIQRAATFLKSPGMFPQGFEPGFATSDVLEPFVNRAVKEPVQIKTSLQGVAAFNKLADDLREIGFLEPGELKHGTAGQGEDYSKEGILLPLGKVKEGAEFVGLVVPDSKPDEVYYIAPEYKRTLTSKFEGILVSQDDGTFVGFQINGIPVDRPGEKDLFDKLEKERKLRLVPSSAAMTAKIDLAEQKRLFKGVTFILDYPTDSTRLSAKALLMQLDVPEANILQASNKDEARALMAQKNRRYVVISYPGRGVTDYQSAIAAAHEAYGRNTPVILWRSGAISAEDLSPTNRGVGRIFNIQEIPEIFEAMAGALKESAAMSIVGNMGADDGAVYRETTGETVNEAGQPVHMDASGIWSMVPQSIQGASEQVEGEHQNNDSAMNGGIDLNAKNMAMNVSGDKLDIKFDPAIIAQFKRGDFSGIHPVIINIAPIASVFPLLGLKEPEESERLAKV